MRGQKLHAIILRNVMVEYQDIVPIVDGVRGIAPIPHAIIGTNNKIGIVAGEHFEIWRACAGA